MAKRRKREAWSITDDWNALSQQQKAIMVFFFKYIEEHGIPPSMREIASACGWSSPATAQNHIQRLIKGGWMTRIPYSNRGLKFLREIPLHRSRMPSVSVPIVGTLSASGAAIRPGEDYGEYTSIDQQRVSVPLKDLAGYDASRVYALRIKDNTLICDLYARDDVLILDPTAMPMPIPLGTTILCYIEDEGYTIRKVMKLGQEVYLVSLNPERDLLALNGPDVWLYMATVAYMIRSTDS